MSQLGSLNNIDLASQYVPLLNKAFMAASVTSDLQMKPSRLKDGQKANEIYYMTMEMDGLSPYSRETGYRKSVVKNDWVHVTFDYDRGSLMEVDTMDNAENFGLILAEIGTEFMTKHVAPEADANFFAKVCTPEGILTGTGAINNATDFLDALLECTNAMDNEDVPPNDRILYATPALVNSIARLDTTSSVKMLDSFSKIIKTPPKRFYTSIELLDKESDQIAGFRKADGAEDIQFMCVYTGSVIKIDKHTAGADISPEANQSKDAHMKKYRKYGVVDVFEKSHAGIYVHTNSAFKE